MTTRAHHAEGPARPEVVLVAAVADNGVIGADGDMPWHVPEDLAHFKATTMGHPMVMGRRTFETIGTPLPGRRSIVLTRDPDWRPAHHDVQVAHTLDEALALGADAEGGEVVMVIGGGQIYAAAMERADRLVITHLDLSPEGEVRFPAIDPEHWQETERDDRAALAFITYRRR